MKGWPKCASACSRRYSRKCSTACAARSLPPHLSSRHKAAHDAHEDTVHPATLRRPKHQATRTGRRGDESARCGEHEGAQEALQLKRRKLDLHVAWQARPPARAPCVEEHGSEDEVVRERKLMQAGVDMVMVNKAHDLAAIVVEKFDRRGVKQSRWGLAGGRTGHFLYDAGNTQTEAQVSGFSDEY
jgi:hypothetical protein